MTMLYDDEILQQDLETNNQTENNKNTKIDKIEHERVVAEYELKISGLQDKYIRLFSDIENMKRRTSEEQRLSSERIEKKIFLDLLPIIDNFERAMNEDNKESYQMSGITLIYSLFQKFLKQHGINEIETTGIFNPELHEAISQIIDNTQETGTIVKIFEKGYYLNNKVLRHSKVAVVA